MDIGVKESDLDLIQDLKSLEDFERKVLGKSSPITEAFKNLKSISDVQEKKKTGSELQALRDFWTNKINQKKSHLENHLNAKSLESEYFDVSLKLESSLPGHLHPITVLSKKIEDIFSSMGFIVLDGPHIEDDWHNFGALNIPADHPARDMHDTFWLKNGKLLRTHTSAVQVRGMEKYRPPFRFIAPGKVFRCERIDASHEAVFHQVEGMLVDKDISVAHLIYFMKSLLSQIFESEVKVRLRPGFFPFVEPGFELDIECLICQGRGCSVCKQSGWVELLPCGLVHPNVLKAGNIDPKEYSAWAFGLGLDRLLMMKEKINDIRYIHSGDLRFVRQFR